MVFDYMYMFKVDWAVKPQHKQTNKTMLFDYMYMFKHSKITGCIANIVIPE